MLTKDGAMDLNRVHQLDQNEIVDFSNSEAIPQQENSQNLFITPSISSKQIWHYAVLLFNNKEYEYALSLFRNLLFRNNKNFEAALKIYECLKRTGRKEESAILAPMLASINRCSRSVYILADQSYSLGQDDQALKLYLEFMSYGDFDKNRIFETYKNLGNIFVRLGEFDTGEEYYNKAYTLKQNSDALLVNFGTLEIQRERYDLAIERFRQALSFNAKSDRAWVGLALLHDRMGDRGLAWGNIDAALDANPQNKTALSLAESWAVEDRMLHRAIKHIENYLIYCADDLEFSAKLATLLIQSHRFAEAKLEISKIEIFDPYHPSLKSLKSELVEVLK